VCLYEGTTHSRARIEQRSSDTPTTWSGQILVSTRGGQALELLERLKKWIREGLTRSGCQDAKLIEPTADKPRSARTKKASPHRTVKTEPEDKAPAPPLNFRAPPPEAISYYVSYAWNDESKAVVDRLCEQSTQRGVTILRDTTGMGLGESITRFMNRLGAGDRVFVILSDKYLKSAFCMYELMEVWRNSKMAGDEFRRRIRVFRLPCAQMATPLQRARYAVFWKQEFTELDTVVREHGPSLLGKADFEHYRLMQQFAHHVGDILALIADTLLPKDFDELIKHGFGDGSPTTPPSG
jgi:internalin A